MSSGSQSIAFQLTLIPDEWALPIHIQEVVVLAGGLAHPIVRSILWPLFEPFVFHKQGTIENSTNRHNVVRVVAVLNHGFDFLKPSFFANIACQGLFVPVYAHEVITGVVPEECNTVAALPETPDGTSKDDVEEEELMQQGGRQPGVAHRAVRWPVGQLARCRMPTTKS